MAYPKFSQTIQALNNVGGTLNTLNALDLAEKNAKLEADLSMARLNLQKKQIEGQQEMSLAQLKAGNARAAEDRAFRNKAREDTEAYRNRVLKNQEDATTDRRKQTERANIMNTPMPVAEAYKTLLEQRGVPKDRIDTLVSEEMRRVSGIFGQKALGMPTTPQNYGQWFENLQKYQHEYELRLAANKTSAKSAVANLALKEAQGTAEIFTKNRVPQSAKEFREVQRTYAKRGIVFDVASGFDENEKPIPVYTARYVEPEIAQTMWLEDREKEFNDQLHGFRNMPESEQKQMVREQLLTLRHGGKDKELEDFVVKNKLREVKPPAGTYPKTMPTGGDGQQKGAGKGGSALQQNAGYFEQGGEGVPGLVYDVAKQVPRALTWAEQVGLPTIVSGVNEVGDRAFPQVGQAMRRLPTQGGGEVFVKDHATGGYRSATSAEAQPRSFLPAGAQAWAERYIAPATNMMASAMSTPTTASIIPNNPAWVSKMYRPIPMNTAQAGTFERLGNVAPGVSDAARLPRMPKYAGERFTSGVAYPRDAIGSPAMELSQPNFVRYGAPVPRALPQGQSRLALPPMRQTPAPVPVETGIEFLPPEYLNYLERYRNTQNAYNQARNTFIPFEQ